MSATQGLWQLIEGLLRAQPFTVEKVEALSGTSMKLDSAETTLHVYRSGKIHLPDGIEFDAELRLRSDDSTWPGFFLLRLRGRCVTRDELFAHYSNLRYTDVPRGRSSSEVTALSSYGSWGELNFMFPVDDSDCVRAISIDPSRHVE